MFLKIKKFILADRPLLLVLVFYLLLRLPFLTLLPIFNDESIYLHWGWKAINISPPYFLFVSLFDGKQPLLMWLFGIAESFIPNPLFAGRMVSVFFGLGTCVGIYLIGKKYFTKNIGILASLIYCIVPLFAFYDRQALMESAISCVGVWVCFFTINYINKPKLLTAFYIGILLGVGLFIKSTSIIFFAAFILLMLYSYYKKQDKYFLYGILIAFITSQVILLPLYNEVDSIKIITTGSRYALTVRELIKVPIGTWIEHVWDSVEVVFLYITPILLGFILVGVNISCKGKDKNRKYIFVWFLITTIIFVIFTRVVSTRYIVSFLPILAVFAAEAIMNFWKSKRLKIIIVIGLALPLALTIFLITSPVKYISLYGKVTKINDIEYISGWTSGFGVIETGEYIKKLSPGEFIHVEVRGDSGNPEDALFVYLRNNPDIRVTYMDFECVGNKAKFKGYLKNVPTYFISRDNRLEGMNKCLTEMKKIYKPDKKNYIGVYKVRA